MIESIVDSYTIVFFADYIYSAVKGGKRRLTNPPPCNVS